MKTKTLLTFLLALSMPVAGIGFAPSFAPKEVKVTFADGEHIHEGNIFTAWDGSDSLPDKTGYYYLTSDVEIPSTWTPAPNTYLCLNGYGIRLTGEGCVIQIAEGKSFNLFDCPFSGVQTHKYAVDETGLAMVDDALTENFETFTGGYITGGNGANGSGISLATGLSNSTTRLTMDGGTIIGNHTTTDGGGISYYWTSGMKGAISLTNATILGNVADKQGGGIFHQASNDKMEFKGKNVITRNVSGLAPAGVLEESLLYIQGDLHIEGNRLTNGNPSDLSVSHAWGQPDRLIVSGELAPTSCIGIDELRRGQIEDYDTYNNGLDPNTILSSNSGDIYGIQDGKVVSNTIDEDLEITYDGEGHVPTVTLLDPSITYTIAYGLEEGTYDLDTPPTFTSAGDHRFYYEIVAGRNTRRGHIDVHIVKEDPVVTLAPTAVEDLAYTGEAQALLVAGTATGGTMEYRIGEGEWSETLPSATNAGTYDVYYRVKGDDLHADLGPVLIQVTISANDKTALSQAIVDAQAYLDTVKDAYAPLIEDMEATILAATAVRDDPNKTVEEISDAADSLSSAKTDLEGAIATLNAAIAAIDAIDDPVTLDSEEGIVAARAAYDGLNEAQQSMIDEATLAKLTDAEATLASLKADRKAADKVIALINAIDATVTLESETGILAARNAYDALTDTAKALIAPETLAKLTDAETTLTTLKVNHVTALIEAIGEVTLDKENDIVAARGAYEALTDDQKDLVDPDTLQALVDAEATLATLKDDKAAADAVTGKIEAIGEVTLDKENEIVAARNAYEALTDAQKVFVADDTLQTLVDAEAALTALKDDKAAADAVTAKINAIGEVTLDKEEAIVDARNAYEALTDAQKAFVADDTLQTLVDAEAALVNIKADKAAADAVTGKIEAIGEVTLDKENEIVETRNAYEALTDAQKAFVADDTLQTLVDAEATLATLKNDKAAADAVADQILTIGTVTLDKEDLILSVRGAYDALTDSQKTFVAENTLKILTDAEAALATLKADKAAADKVTALIDGIGEVTLDKEDKILAARAAFDGLTDAQKAFVSPQTLSKLTQAEVALAALKGDQAAAEKVSNLIRGIGEVTLDKENAIIAARTAYDGLSDDQKAFIEPETLALLTSAEEALSILKANKAAADKVTALIDGIGVVTLEKEEAIIAARTAYNALNDAQKPFVSAETLKKLTDAEATLAALKGDEAAAAYVEGLIEAIGEVTLDKEDAIIAARNAYDGLTDRQKEILSPESLQRLLDAEAELAQLKLDYAEAERTRFMIEAIGEVTLEKETLIVSAREAYDALNDQAKAFLDEAIVQTLLDAEATLAALKADKAAIDHVKELIEGIGIITLEKENDILAARAAYEALTDAQKAQVSQYLLNMLRNAEKTLAALKADKAAIDGFKALVEAVGEVDDSDACLQRIQAAKSAYAALTEEQQAAVDAEYQALLQKEQAHYKVVSDKRLASTLTIVGIALGGVLALLLLIYAAMFLVFRKFAIEPVNEKVIRLARVGRKADIVTLLTPRLKKVRFRENDLYGSKREARAVLSLVQGQRNGVIAAIHAIGEISLEKEEEISLARKSFDALPDQQKAKIDASDIRILEVAEETLASLKAKASAKRVEALIRQMGKEPEANPAAIEMARKAYDALSENERSYLSSYSLAKLEEAEALLRDAPKEDTKKKKAPKDEED